MKSKLILLLLALSILACENEKQNNVFVKGNIEGIRKGDIYLQKLEDTILVSLDSVQFLGNEDFELKGYVEEPQLMFLYLKKFGSDDDAQYLDFFGEKGEFEFNVKMDEFTQAKASKSPENQQKYQDYLNILKRFNNQNLDLISEQIQTQKEDTIAQKEIDEKYRSLLRRKYLYTVNYALKNADYEVAPFLVLTEAYDVNKKFLDTVYNSLSKDVKSSKYGKELKNLVDLRAKEANTQNTEVKTLDEDVDS